MGNGRVVLDGDGVLSPTFGSCSKPQLRGFEINGAAVFEGSYGDDRGERLKQNYCCCCCCVVARKRDGANIKKLQKNQPGPHRGVQRTMSSASAACLSCVLAEPMCCRLLRYDLLCHSPQGGAFGYTLGYTTHVRVYLARDTCSHTVPASQLVRSFCVHPCRSFFGATVPPYVRIIRGETISVRCLRFHTVSTAS